MIDVPTVTAEQMREIDRIAVEDLHLELAQMMENAGRNLADLALRRFRPESVAVLSGRGGNGGGGLVAARHLANRGVSVSVTLSHASGELSPVTAHQLDITNRMGIPAGTSPGPATLVIDALIGYSLQGNPAGRTAALIAWANDQPSPILALDVPSGLDATTGRAATPCIRAAATLTLALPKAGLVDSPEAGALFLADISIPPDAYGRLGLSVPPLFETETTIALGPDDEHLPRT